MWKFRVANDQRIISAVKVEDANMDFTYDSSMMLPDQHAELSDSLSSMIDAMQETVTWLFNSRITSVRNNIETKLVVHPSAVEMSDLEARSPFIRLKKSAAMGLGVNSFIQQLKTVDPTTTHLDDASRVMQMIQTVSGVNENAMGQFHGGRRSATEARNVQGGAAGRLKMIASSVWASGLANLGRRLLINARQWLTMETFLKIVGDNEETWAAYEQFHAPNWWDLVGNEDFFVFDGTAQGEKAYVAQSLQELLLGLMANPEVLIASNLDPVKMIEEIQALRGVRNLNRFERDTPIQPTAPALPGGQPQLNAGNGMP